MTSLSSQVPEQVGDNLSLQDIEVDPSSYVDPNGFVFHFQGHVYRAIRAQYAPFYRRLFSDGVIDRLAQRVDLVKTELTPYTVSAAGCDLVLRHQRIEPVTYCVEWSPSMLREAALLTLDLALAALEHDLIVQDAYPWNVLFQGPRPVFIDFCSIAQDESGMVWPAYHQFLSFFLYPLALCQSGKGPIARKLLLDNINGVCLGEYYATLSQLTKLTHPWIPLQLFFDRMVQRHPNLKRRIKRRLVGGARTTNRSLRRGFFQRVRKKVASFSFTGKRDIWSDYYADIPPGVDKNEKVNLVRSLLQRISPTSVLDLGCNTGVFSVLAAQEGAGRVAAVDTSEACIERLYHRARQDDLPITPLVADVLCPTPAFGFMARQYPPLFQRLRSEVVLCLALMHHLHIAGRQSFERIAELLDAVATKSLVFEYVDVTDPNNDLIGLTRRIDYDLDLVSSTLARYFPIIETLPSDRSTRRLLLCSKES